MGELGWSFSRNGRSSERAHSLFFSLVEEEPETLSLPIHHFLFQFLVWLSYNSYVYHMLFLPYHCSAKMISGLQNSRITSSPDLEGPMRCMA